MTDTSRPGDTGRPPGWPNLPLPRPLPSPPTTKRSPSQHVGPPPKQQPPIEEAIDALMKELKSVLPGGVPAAPGTPHRSSVITPPKEEKADKEAGKLFTEMAAQKPAIPQTPLRPLPLPPTKGLPPATAQRQKPAAPPVSAKPPLLKRPAAPSVATTGTIAVQPDPRQKALDKTNFFIKGIKTFLENDVNKSKGVVTFLQKTSIKHDLNITNNLQTKGAAPTLPEEVASKLNVQLELQKIQASACEALSQKATQLLSEKTIAEEVKKDATFQALPEDKKEAFLAAYTLEKTLNQLSSLYVSEEFTAYQTANRKIIDESARWVPLEKAHRDTLHALSGDDYYLDYPTISGEVTALPVQRFVKQELFIKDASKSTKELLLDEKNPIDPPTTTEKMKASLQKLESILYSMSLVTGRLNSKRKITELEQSISMLEKTFKAAKEKLRGLFKGKIIMARQAYLDISRRSLDLTRLKLRLEESIPILQKELSAALEDPSEQGKQIREEKQNSLQAHRELLEETKLKLEKAEKEYNNCQVELKKLEGKL